MHISANQSPLFWLSHWSDLNWSYLDVRYISKTEVDTRSPFLSQLVPGYCKFNTLKEVLSDTCRINYLRSDGGHLPQTEWQDYWNLSFCLTDHRSIKKDRHIFQPVRHCDEKLIYIYPFFYFVWFWQFVYFHESMKISRKKKIN